MQVKHILFGLAAFAAAAAHAETQVGVSVSVNQPGFYGRIDIGNRPPPPVIYPQPVIVQPVVVQHRSPVYLRVPPGHEKQWDKHCHKYNACAQPVYFVKAEAVPSHPRHSDPRDEHHHGGKHGGKGEGKGEGRGKGHDKHDKHGKHD